MNIIRTTAVELTSIPAIAYKQKLQAGGAGIKIMRLDLDVSNMFTIDRRTGEAVPYGKYVAELFPEEAVDEALELTTGLPYSARGKIKITVFEVAEEEDDVAETEIDKIDMVNSQEYAALINRYTNEKGKLNYALMNKDYIQFASRSKVVADMVASKSDADAILLYVVNSMVSQLTSKKNAMSVDETNALLETLDEIDPRSAFKELKAHIRRMLAKPR